MKRKSIVKNSNDKAITSKVYRCHKKLREINNRYKYGCIWTAEDCWNYTNNIPCSEYANDVLKYRGDLEYRDDWMEIKGAVSWYKDDDDYDIAFRDTYDDELLAEFGHELVECIEYDYRGKINRWYIKPLDSLIQRVTEQLNYTYLYYYDYDPMADNSKLERCYDYILPTRLQYESIKESRIFIER